MPQSSLEPKSRTSFLLRLIPVFEKIGDAISQACQVLAAIALFIIVGINGLNVACRYFAGFAFSWAEEAMLFLMVLMVFAGAIAAAWRGSHMHLNMLVENLPPGLRRAAIIFSALASVVLLGVLSLSSYQVVSLLYRFGQKSVALEFPMWIPQGCVLAGFILIAVMIVLRLAVFGAQLPKSEAEELAEQQS